MPLKNQETEGRVRTQTEVTQRNLFFFLKWKECQSGHLKVEHLIQNIERNFEGGSEEEVLLQEVSHKRALMFGSVASGNKIAQK